MSAPTASNAPVARCRVCEIDVPAGEFCGWCGLRLQRRRGDGPDWVRIGVFGAAPGEHVLRPALASSLFPHLPPGSRTAFRWGLALLVCALVAFALLRMPGCLIATAALGLPVLFVLYLREADAVRDFDGAALLLAATLGVLLGVGWVLLTGELMARAYGVPLGGGLVLARAMREGVGIPLGGAVLMLLPAVLVRLVRPSNRESLDGFVIGALGALSFTAAATLTRLAPQLATGLINRSRPTSGLLVEAVLRGAAVPLTAAAIGGLVGAALWFRRPASKADQHAGWVRAALASFAAGVLLIYVALGLVDVQSLSQWVQLCCHLAMTLLAVLLLRVGLQLALLHESTDDVDAHAPIRCPTCSQVVPDMAFCPCCGVATRAASRTSRRARRLARPRPADAADADGELCVATALPAPRYRAAPVARTPRRRVIAGWVGAISAVALALVGVAAVMSTPAVRYACPPNCGRPPTGTPVTTNPRFTAADGAFTVSYPAAGAAYDVTQRAAGVTARYTAGDTGTLQLFGQPAAGRSPEQIVRALLASTYPDFRTAYQIPNAMVGYQPGYGEVADCWPQGANSNYTRMRIVVVAAVKDDLALIAAAVGPFRQFGPDVGPGPPSGANLELAQDMGKYVNSFRWRGDPQR